MKNNTSKRGGAFALAEIIVVLALIALLAAIALPQTAQAGIQNSVLNGGTNNVAALSTNNYQTTANNTFTFATTTKGFLGISAACNAASTANYDFTFDTTVDGSKWQTNAFAVRLVGNGTASVTTNYAIPSTFLAPQIRIGTIANTNATAPALTNINVNGFDAKGL